MPNQRFVIVDVKKRLYFAKKQSDYFTKDYEKASKWDSKADVKKALTKICNKREIKEKTEKLVVKELQLAVKELQSTEKSIEQSAKESIEQTLEEPKENIKEVSLPDYEDFLDQLEKLCFLMRDADRIKRQLEKKISESDGNDLDFLHILELGKFNAAQGSKLIKWEKESRRLRRQYKDEWTAISTLLPVANDGLANNAEKCLEVLEKIKKNKRLYRFRNKETDKKFGKLLSQNSETNENDNET